MKALDAGSLLGGRVPDRSPYASSTARELIGSELHHRDRHGIVSVDLSSLIHGAVPPMGRDHLVASAGEAADITVSYRHRWSTSGNLPVGKPLKRSAQDQASSRYCRWQAPLGWLPSQCRRSRLLAIKRRFPGSRQIRIPRGNCLRGLDSFEIPRPRETADGRFLA